MRAISLTALILVILAGLGMLVWQISPSPIRKSRDTYDVEITDVKPPSADPADSLTDDRLEDKKPLTFDPSLVDRRPLGPKQEWLVNSSAAVLHLDIPAVRPDTETHLSTLYPSYTAAIKAMPSMPGVLLSANMLDGKAKQFDDGLYAALDLGYYRGLNTVLHSHVGFVRRLYA